MAGATTAQNSYGFSYTGTTEMPTRPRTASARAGNQYRGIYASYTAIGCYGISFYGTGLTAYAANNCVAPVIPRAILSTIGISSYAIASPKHHIQIQHAVMMTYDCRQTTNKSNRVRTMKIKTQILPGCAARVLALLSILNLISTASAATSIDSMKPAIAYGAGLCQLDGLRGRHK